MSQAGESTELTRRLGRLLAAERTSQGISQKDMAAMVGVHASGIYRIEQGLFTRFSTVIQYAECFGYGIDVTLVPLEEAS